MKRFVFLLKVFETPESFQAGMAKEEINAK